MQIVELNLVPKGVSPVIYLSQFDIKRPFQVRIYDDVDAYRIPSGAIVKIEGVKQDSKIFEYSSDLDPDVISYSEDLVTVNCTEQMTAIHGAVYAEIVVESDGSTIATLNFTIQIERSALGGYTDASHSEITGLTAITKEVEKIRDEAKTYGDAASASETNASKYAEAAKKSADDAATSETNSKTSETNASNSATAASTSEANAKKSEDHIEEMMDNFSTAQSDLQSTIDDANSTNTTLKQTTSDAKDANQTLVTNTTAATTANTTLVANTTTADAANDALTASTTAANTANENLGKSIATSATSKADLDASIQEANNAKVGLDASNATATKNKTDLDAQNDRANTNITDLKTQNARGEEILKASSGVMSISVNGELQTPSETKNVNISVPTAVTDLTDAGDYAKKTDLPTVPKTVAELTDADDYAKKAEVYIPHRFATTMILAAVNWSGTSAPYKYHIPLSPDITDNSPDIFIGFDSSTGDMDDLNAFADARIQGGPDGDLYLYAWGEDKPTTGIPITILATWYTKLG